MNVRLAFAGLLALASCVASNDQPVIFADQREYTLTVSPNGEGQAFEVLLVSKSDTALCLGIDMWPNSLGRLHMGADLAQIEVGGRAFPARDDNFGYCIGQRCTITIQPRQSLSGRIGFAEFDGWDWRRDLEHSRLNFDVHPLRC